MNKKELAEEVSNDTGLSFRQSWDAVNSVLNAIEKALKSDGKVNLVGFGTFLAHKRKAREGRNPRTGESIMIPSSRTPKFTPAKNLKDALKA